MTLPKYLCLHGMDWCFGVVWLYQELLYNNDKCPVGGARKLEFIPLNQCLTPDIDMTNTIQPISVTHFSLKIFLVCCSFHGAAMIMFVPCTVCTLLAVLGLGRLEGRTLLLAAPG